MLQDTEQPQASATGAKKTRHEIAALQGLSLRYIDQLTSNGLLPYFRIGKAIRYDAAEVEAVMRERFHVRAKPRKQAATGTTAA